MSLIFVYGTLKRGCRNHAYLAGQAFAGEACTPPGFRLYDLGDYPGMVLRPDDRQGVTGEVWSVDAVCLARLDHLEGTAEGLYVRQALPLLPPFADRGVESYLYLRSVDGRPVVGSTWRE